MTPDHPMPMREALQFAGQKKILPTTLDSAGVRALDADVRNSSMVSAQTAITDILGGYKQTVIDMLDTFVDQRPDRVTATNPEGNVNVGLNSPAARLQMKAIIDGTGYRPSVDERGTIKDLSSDARINLVLDTNKDIAQGFTWFAQGQDRAVLDAFPCQELVRIEDRDKKRDWETRWKLCAQVVGDVDAFRVAEETGRMIARKDSEIWQALGDGEDGSIDTLGNPFPPFAFNSGMGVRDIPYTESLSLGLITPDDQVAAQEIKYPVMEAAA